MPHGFDSKREYKNILLFTPGFFLLWLEQKNKINQPEITGKQIQCGLEKKPNFMLNIANGHETNDPKLERIKYGKIE